MSNQSRVGRSSRVGAAESSSDSVDATELTGVLSDEHAREILRAVRDEPRPARELVDACEASRPTVYRRLDALRDVGLVEATMECHPDGHHRQVFGSSVDEVTISLDPEGFAVTVKDSAPGADVGTAD